MELFLYILKNWLIIVVVWLVLFVFVILSAIAINLFFMLLTALSPNAKFAESEFYFKDLLLKDIEKRFCQKKHLNFLDIGSGNGAVVMSVATRFRNIKAYGIEFNYLLFKWSKILTSFICIIQRFLGTNCEKQIKLLNKDAFELSSEFFKKFDIVYIFTQMYRLMEYEKILKKLSKGTIIYTLYFQLPKSKMFKKLKTYTRFEQHLYVYKKVG